MQINEYQQRAISTAIYPGQNTVNGLIYTVLGLGEVGELQGKVKKILRDDKGVVTEEKRQALIGELGDVLWYVAATAIELGVSLESVAQANIEKLESRQQRGVLTGSGDNR